MGEFHEGRINDNEAIETGIPRAINFTLFGEIVPVLAKIDRDKVIAIIEEDGSYRKKPIILKAPDVDLDLDALLEFFRVRGVLVIMDKQEGQEPKLVLDVIDLNRSISERGLTIVDRTGNGQGELKGLTDFVLSFSEEHVFEQKYDPEKEIE